MRSRSAGDMGSRALDTFIADALEEIRRKDQAGPALAANQPRSSGTTEAQRERLKDSEDVIAFDRSPRRDDRVRTNERIRVREVRVIDETGQQLGIMPPPQALTIARQKGLDLVEISPTAVPPVCRIMDFGQYQYQEQKRAREAKKHQRVIEVKEIKFRPKVDVHDYEFKKKHIERFLAEGDKVKATIFFRGREMAHPEIGRRILERLMSELADVALAETMPRQEGNQMHVILTPADRPQERAESEGGNAAAEPEAEPDTSSRNRGDICRNSRHTGAPPSASRRRERARSSGRAPSSATS